ncbi:MAG: formylglycine-generating enzyme family protein, partial [Planctomycetota bacterium]|nr:formylglycine-generating enzyme family protein [Planctomycetota bacterium]
EEEARAQAKAAEVMAAKAQEDLARSGMLLDNSWWRLTPEQAAEQQRAAAAVLGWPVERRVELAAGVELTLMLIPSGAFAMGSPAAEAKRAGWEYLHRVEITKPFYLSRYEMTEAQWLAAVGALPGGRKVAAAAKMPATEISWDDVQQRLLPNLNRLAPPGFAFRLPTEAEWEYACRAGAVTAYYAGADIEALERCGWYIFNSDRRVHEVGSKAANAWGLYDMHGNVAEWCEDLHDPLYYLRSPVADPVLRQEGRQRVTRGGSCLNLAEHCRCAYRSYANRDSRYKFLGVRVALAPVLASEKREE